MAIFKKLNIGDTVATSGTRAFRKLTTELPIWNGTDLKGTTWEIHSVGLTAEAGYGEFDVVGKDVYEGNLDFYDLRIGYRGYNKQNTLEAEGHRATADYVCWNIVYLTGMIGYRNAYKTEAGDIAIHSRTLTFTGGADVTNTRLIDWLIWNAKLTSHQPAHNGGLYDANDNLVASWNALKYTYGMDVLNLYSTTDPKAPAYIFANNSELSGGTKLIVATSVWEGPLFASRNSAFQDCTNLKSVIISDGVKYLDNYMFMGCTNLTDIVIPNSVNRIYTGVFASCTSLKSITIPDSVTLIGNQAFLYCPGLTNIVIPNSVTNIGVHAFQNCANLTSVTIGNGLTSIATAAFQGCINLASVTIPNGVTSVENTAFYQCSGLTSVTIPASVTTIGLNAFGLCKNLADVYYGGTEEQWGVMAVGVGNDYLKNATIHYNYTG